MIPRNQKQRENIYSRYFQLKNQNDQNKYQIELFNGEKWMIYSINNDYVEALANIVTFLIRGLHARMRLDKSTILC